MPLGVDMRGRQREEPIASGHEGKTESASPGSLLLGVNIPAGGKYCLE